MWRKKLSNNQRSAPQSSTLLQGTPYGATVFAAGGGSDSFQQRSPPERPRPPQTDVKRKGLPPSATSSPPQPPPHQEPKFRPVSSIYSQPSSPNALSRQFPHEYAYPDVEVSPPSSPEFGKSLAHGDDEVSPIDATPDASSIRFGRASNTSEPHARNSSGGGANLKPNTSSIPVMRREKRRTQVATTAASLVQRKQVGDAPQGRKTSDVRWDPYSGEITTSNRGKPQSVKPGEFTPPGGARSMQVPGMGNTSTITGPAKPGSMSFGDRVRKLKPLNTPVEKPEWKGATGRATIVAPVADQPDIAPLSIPRKSSKRVGSPIVQTVSTPISAIRTTTIDETGPVSSPQVEPTIRAVPTHSNENSPKGGVSLSPTPEPTEPAAAAAAPSSAIRLTLDTSSPTAPTHKKKDSADTIERNFREALQRSFNPNPSEPYVQPPSRFSVTTYATSTATGESPRASTDSSRPPMPTPPWPYNAQDPPAPATPILNRKRPKIGEPKPKSGEPSSPVLISMTSSIATKRQNDKSLPKSPAEVESQDLISSLQAQLDNLSNRRNNIMKSIRQMTELMPTDHVVETAEVRRKRDEEKQKIEFLKEEEADIRRQEHDLGLRLHRAWKRKDNDAAYEQTGLWVKRVTG